ncbi:hypothetical protein DFH11DRAFT_1728194 [Phellopilus nigrolimitatus]|nr:hypothetical protein DFH11DRAFT_1728194 [Phellopilus nigrolimitatus]
MATSTSSQATLSFFRTMLSATVALASGSHYKAPRARLASFASHHANDPHRLALSSPAMVGTSHVSHVIAGVKRLPRKASRLVCLTDPSLSPQDPARAPAPSFTDSVSSGDSANSSEMSEANDVPLWNPGPIIPPDELEAALDKLPDTPNPPPTRQPKHLSISIPPVSDTLPSARQKTPDPSPRPLSPPPAHFRRRNNGADISPFCSPPCSPHARGPVLALHDVLPSESLVAPPLRLYAPGLDDNISHDNIIRESAGSLRVKAPQTNQEIRRVFSG